MEEKLLKAKEVCKFLGVTEDTVWKYCREGKLKSVKMGRLRRFKKEDVESFIENHN